MAPGVAPSFKQLCAHTHLLSLRCSPDSDNSLFPAILCQPPLQPATRLVDTEQSSSTQPALLPLGLVIPKLWKSVCSEEANAGTGVQPTFAF